MAAAVVVAPALICREMFGFTACRRTLGVLGREVLPQM